MSHAYIKNSYLDSNLKKSAFKGGAIATVNLNLEMLHSCKSFRVAFVFCFVSVSDTHASHG